MTYNLIKYTKGLDCFALQNINEFGIVEFITDLNLNSLEIPEVTEGYTVAENIDITQPIDVSIYIKVD